jgi:PAS domain S-box-containing protein
MARLATGPEFPPSVGSGRPGVEGYAVAVLAVMLAIIAASVFATAAPVSTFTLAVIVSAWFGGTRPGILAIALSFAALVVHVELVHIERLGYFLFISSFIVWVIASERTTLTSLRRAVEQLTMQNEMLMRESAEGQTLQERLRGNEAELRLVIDTIPTMAWTLGPDGRLEFLNRRWLDYSGLTMAQALDDATLTMHPDDKAQALETWSRAFTSGVAYEGEMRLRRADGQYRRFLIRTVPLLDEQGKIVRWYGTSMDIEDRDRAERKLRDSAQRLQQLSHRLLTIQEDERRHLARELHDEFGQLLAAVTMHLHAARAIAGSAAQPSLDECADLLKRAGEQVRSLALELRPAILETAGLDGTLRWLANQHQQRTGISFEVAGEAGRVPPDVAIACFRVAQESLTNVVRHSQARHVSIRLSWEDGHLHLETRDDGVGFDVARTVEGAAQGGHLGLVGMRERVQILGGTLRIDSRPGEGTRIAVSFPVI